MKFSRRSLSSTPLRIKLLTSLRSGIICQRVQGEGTHMMQAGDDLQHSTEEISQRTLTQQELEHGSHEELGSLLVRAVEQLQLEQDAAPR